MPPPTTPTTRGYFGSPYFNVGYFGADYWKERVPVPAPVVLTGANGGIGGGKTLYYEELPPSVWAIDPSTTGFATVLAGKMNERHEMLEKLGHVDPLSKKHRSTTEYDLRETVRRLREKAADLERALAEANAKVMLPWKLLEEARAEIDRLRAAAAQHDVEIEQLQRIVQRQALELSQVKAMLGAVQSIKFPPFEELWAKTMADMPVAAARAPIEIPWAEVLGAALGFVLTATVVPKTWPMAKAFGYAASSALAFAAVRRVVSPARNQ